jgi:hypothetical protein
MSGRLRKRLIIAGAVVAALLAAWTGAWFTVQGEIRRQTLAWIEQQRAQRATIDYETLAVSGWPLWWRITIEAPHVVFPPGMQGEWRGTRAQAWLRPWAFRNIWLRFEGDHSLTIPNTIGAGSGPTMTVTLSATEPDARVLIGSDGRPQEVELDSRDFALEAPAPIGNIRGARAHLLAQLHPPPASHLDPLLDATVSLIDLDLPQPPVPGLATRVQRADLDLSFRGNLPPRPLPEAIAAWRDDGGTIEISHLVLVSAPIDFDGNGTLALDAQNRVQLACTGRLRGYAETIDALQRARTLPATQAFAIRTAFAFLQQQGPDGRLEVRAQAETFEGTLRVNGIPVARMLPLRFE